MPRPIDADALKASFEEDGHLSAYIEECIDDAPTLDYAPVRHSYWKHETPTKDDGQKPFVCSECGLRHPRYGDTDKAYFTCCPWCGARMDAKEDEHA